MFEGATPVAGGAPLVFSGGAFNAWPAESQTRGGAGADEGAGSTVAPNQK